MIDVSICPICQSTEWRNSFQVADHSISRETFTLKECNGCSLIITSPRPDEAELFKYYHSDNYISHSGKPNNLVNRIYLLAREYSLKWKLRLANDLQPRGRILDMGCGTGEFLNVLKKAGWKIEGVEPNAIAREKAEQLTSTKIHNSFNDITGSFNLITLWHVLEHLPNPGEAIGRFSEQLATHGNLLVAVPNHKSWDAQKYEEHWAGYDVPRHLWHFNQSSMVLLLQKYGFKLKRIIPMKLDAFYVSMLSEKYKGGKSAIQNPLKGFISGLQSNRNAKKTGEYSSLIYVAEK